MQPTSRRYPLASERTSTSRSQDKLRGWRAATATVLVVAGLANAAHGQAVAPPPNEPPPLAADVSPLGHFSTAVPLDLPAPRGDVPIPLTVRYDGDRVVGEAGLGWSIPFSYVRQPATVSGLKPKNQISGLPEAGAEPAQRTFLDLGGGPMLMLPSLAADRYQPMMAEAEVELVGPASDGTWRAYDRHGRVYTFSRPAGLRDDTLWLLTRVTDRTGNNHVELRYRVEQVPVDLDTEWGESGGSGGSASAEMIDELFLDDIRYAFGPGGCPKYRVELRYRAPEPEHPYDLLALTVHDGTLRARTKIMDELIVWSHEDGACAEAARNRLRTYRFHYASDADRGQPRLVAVDEYGQGDVATDPATALPVARYDYGAATSGDTLTYGSEITTPLPSELATLWGGIEATSTWWTMLDVDPDYHLQQQIEVIRDFTGDGLPDLVLPVSEKLADGLQIARNRPIPSTYGWNELAAPVPLLTGADLEHPGSTDVVTSSWFDDGLRWRQAIDWNGDGRVDIVDAQGSGDPRYWRVLLNTPGPDGTGADIVWGEVLVDITGLREQVKSRLPPDVVLADDRPFPVGQTRRIATRWQDRCRHYVSDVGDGLWHLESCLEEASPEVWQDYQVTGWSLSDVNGDKIPDFVFNSEQHIHHRSDPWVSLTPTCAADYCPSTVTDPSEIPAACVGECTDIRTNRSPDLSPFNQVLVIYNRGVGTPSLGGEPDVLLDHAWCGVERVRLGIDCESCAGHERTVEHMRCGFTDVTGDGIADYIVDEGRAREQHLDQPIRALIGTGTPSGLREAVAIRLPGAPFVTHSNQGDICDPDSEDPWSQPPFRRSQLSSIIDLTGDGVPDYVYFGRRNAIVAPDGTEFPVDAPGLGDSTLAWWFMVGTTTGFVAPRRIATTGAVPFELFAMKNFCPGVSQGIEGLGDMDGDGRPDPTSVEAGQLRASKIIGASGTPGAHDAGRLIRIDNGYGGVTVIEYGNAKTETATPHQVPYPEIVVTRVSRVAERGVGTSVEPVRYAYGHAAQRYQPLLGRWSFAGYGRTVALHGLPLDEGSAEDDVSVEGDIVGIARITDRMRPDEVPGGYEGHALLGAARDTYVLDGVFDGDPRLLLGLAVDGPPPSAPDPRWHGGTHVQFAVRVNAASPPSFEALRDCYDSDGYTAGIDFLAEPLCLRTGFSYASDTIAWNGTAPPPLSGSSPPIADGAVVTRTIVRSVDAFGRPLLIEHQNDTARADDDYCTRYRYAVGASGDRRVLDAVASVHRGDCAQSGGVTYSAVRFQYDRDAAGNPLPEGQVSVGLPARSIAEIYRPDTAAKVGEIVLADAWYDAYGNEIASQSTRDDGVTARRSIDELDPFRLSPTRATTTATGAAPTSGLIAFDPVSMQPLLATDAHGVKRRTTYDRFGRTLRETVTLPEDGIERVVSETVYLGDDPADPLGRRALFRSFDAPPPAATPSAGIETMVVVDELGRAHYREGYLGADYADDRIITDHVVFDGLGRPSVVYAAYLPTEPLDARYRTRLEYYADNRIKCAHEGTAAADEWLACTSYGYEDSQLVVRSRGRNEMRTDDPRFGVVDESRLTAIGWEVRRSRIKAASELELMTLSYDRLGQLETVERFAEPGDTTSPSALWFFVTDSLGRTVEVHEPDASPQYRQFDSWGAVKRARWLDASTGEYRGTMYWHDGLGRVLGEVDAFWASDTAPATIAPETITTYHYDRASSDPNHVDPGYTLGRLTWVDDPVTRTFYGYNSVGDTTVTTRVHRDVGVPHRERAGYTAAGRMEWMAFELPDIGAREKIGYTYDSAGRMRTAAWSDPWTTKELFRASIIDPFGRVRERQNGNGTKEQWFYREGGRREWLTYLLDTADRRFMDSAPLVNPYDGDGRLWGKQEMEMVRGTFDAAWRTYAFDYDLSKRLASERVTTGTTTTRHDAFAYDGLGNLKAVTDYVGADDWTFSRAVGDPDRLCGAHKASQPTLGGTIGTRNAPACTHQYDALGNVVSIADPEGTTRAFVYDARSRLVQARKGSATADVRYDAAGRVAELTIFGAGPNHDRHVRRYGDLVEAIRLPGSSDYVLQRTILGPGGATLRRRGFGPMAVEIYEHGDGRGTRRTTNDDGVVIQQLEYDAYGNAMTDTGPKGTVDYTWTQWNGGDALAAFGLVQLGARFYDTRTARFLQRDPLVIPRSASQTHPYAFAFGDPINFGDPTGLDGTEIGRWEAPGGTWFWYEDGSVYFRDVEGVYNYMGGGDDHEVITVTDSRRAWEGWRETENKLKAAEGLSWLTAILTFGLLGGEVLGPAGLSEVVVPTTVGGMAAEGLTAPDDCNGCTVSNQSGGGGGSGSGVPPVVTTGPGGLRRFAVRVGRRALEEGGSSSGRSTIAKTVEDSLGESLEDYEYFLHGTTDEVAKDFEVETGRSLFTATDPRVARFFAERSVAKAGGGQIGGVAIVLPRDAVRQLRSAGLLVARPISDMPHFLEWVFSPGAVDTIRRAGDIVTLPPGAL